MQKLAVSNSIRRALLLKTGQTTSYGSGTGVDDGALQIGEARRYTVLTADQYSGTTNITLNAKTDVHNNACVIDGNTGLMWSRSVSASVGPSSNGTLPWTTNGSGEGIFTYAAAANLAALAGYTDWRIPNRTEYVSLQLLTPPNVSADPTAFPAMPASNLWSSSTNPNNTTTAYIVAFTTTGALAGSAKTNSFLTTLVRGPIS